MRIKDIDKKGYKLHLIKTNKFKTVLVKIVFWNKIKKEELALRNLLVNSLLFSSKNYDTPRKMAIKSDELFSMDLYNKTYRRGNYVLSEINVSLIEDKYSSEGVLKQGIEFLFDIVNNPHVEDNKFDIKSFKVNYGRLETAIRNESENPSYYAYKRFKEEIGSDKTFTNSLLGTIEELSKITEENLYDYYKKFINENFIDIYVVGNINFKELEKLIEDNFKPNEREIKYSLKEVSYEKEFTSLEEDSKYNQSKLLLGASLSKLTKHEKLYEAILYNIILGNSPNSKLFQNVREKKSFAYSIASSINRLDGLLYIYVGISSKNKEETKEEVLKQIEEMKQGKFTEANIKNAKQVILSVIKEVDEYPGAILDHYMNYLYFGNEKLVNQKQEIKKIRKEDIVKVANKINIDTIYLLKESSNEKISNK